MVAFSSTCRYSCHHVGVFPLPRTLMPAMALPVRGAALPPVRFAGLLQQLRSASVVNRSGVVSVGEFQATISSSPNLRACCVQPQGTLWYSSKPGLGNRLGMVSFCKVR